MILTYHNIGSGNDKTWVSLDAFRKQIETLHQMGFEIVTLEKYDHFNPKHIVITFDDGHKNILDAIEILKKYQYPFYVFLVGKNIGASDEYLSEYDFDTIKKSGGFLGWHTWTHPDLKLVLVGKSKKN